MITHQQYKTLDTTQQSAPASSSKGVSMPAVPVLQRKEEENVISAPVQTKSALQFAINDDITSVKNHLPFQLKPNNTGMPDQLKSGIENLSGISNDRAVIQRYTTSVDGAYNVSTNREFAVPTAAYPNVILTQHRPPTNLAGGLIWNANGAIQIDGVDYTQYVANIDAYENQETGRIVGSSQFCGEFARGITGGPAPTEDTSETAEGGILYDSNTTPGREEGWENHYAAVVMVDAGDHATFETAVGINHVWAGIYGTARGQTFKYRTQIANIERLIAMEDIVFPAQYRTERGFWDYLFCRRGRRVQTMAETRVTRGVTEGEGGEWMRQMQAWRDHNTIPTDPYVIRIVEKLTEEEQSLQQN